MAKVFSCIHCILRKSQNCLNYAEKVHSLVEIVETAWNFGIRALESGKRCYLFPYRCGLFVRMRISVVVFQDAPNVCYDFATLGVQRSLLQLTKYHCGLMFARGSALVLATGR